MEEAALGDAYSGHVDPGGGPVERRDGRLLVRKLSVGDMDNNVYVVADASTGAAMIVDAAADAERIRQAASDLEPVAVLQTHGHWDHVRAWPDLATDPGLDVWGHADDRELFPREPDRLLDDGDQLQLGGMRVEVIHTPGHTPGSINFLVGADQRPHLFTGDSLFPGGVGRTTPETFPQLFDNVKKKLFARLPDETWVYPGHGDDTTLGRERPHLDEWRARGW
ncbi:MAG: MBL fold metallo-hydrolase [Actinobacteria bacterium]|nr:MBL fold metallo-hydrolase [Actinomycetota bacterium]